MFGDANHATDFFRNEFMMGAEHSVAIQAVHGATHTAHIGVKYTWFGSGYISNMFYKMIANHPTYDFELGGDMSFINGDNVLLAARGDSEGQPRQQTGWRASCMMMWNTPEGGPCVLRPSGSQAADSPDPEHHTVDCVSGYTEDRRPVISTETKGCEGAWADENNIIHGAAYEPPLDEVVGPYSAVDENDNQQIKLRHNTGWNNQFAFPWEISAYWNFTSR